MSVQEQWAADIADDVAWIAGLPFDHETSALVCKRLVCRLEDFVSSRGCVDGTVKLDLSAVFDRDGNSFVTARPVITGEAPNLRLCVSLSFDPEGYRRCADSAKDALIAGGA